MDLFTNHLRLSPAPPIVSTTRLGKFEREGTSRRMLVRFTSDSAASTVLLAARSLRNSDDPVIASRVFINPDLSKEESKLAYEKRVTKRGRQISMDHSSSNPSASGGTISGSSYSAPRSPSTLADLTATGIPSMVPPTLPVSAPPSLRPSAAIFMPAACNSSAPAGSIGAVAGIPLPVQVSAGSSAQLPSTLTTEVSVA